MHVQEFLENLAVQFVGENAKHRGQFIRGLGSIATIQWTVKMSQDVDVQQHRHSVSSIIVTSKLNEFTASHEQHLNEDLKRGAGSFFRADDGRFRADGRCLFASLNLPLLLSGLPLAISFDT